MNTRAARVLFLWLFFGAVWLWASQPWSKDPGQWTSADVKRMLSDSPWAKSTNATFPNGESEEKPPPAPLPGPESAGMAGPRGVSDGRWDGGVGRMPRGGTPSLPVTVRWDSAFPVRQALQTNPGDTQPSDLSAAASKDYIITVLGLVPAGKYKSGGRLATNSQSRPDAANGNEPEDPEPMLENIMGASRLFVRGHAPVRPDDVKLDATTGTLHLFFSRSLPIQAEDREVIFVTQFGSLSVRIPFRLKDMLWRKRLEL